MTWTARSNFACEPCVRSRKRARSWSVSCFRRARSMAEEVVAMPRTLEGRAAGQLAAGHRRQDHEHVSVADAGVETVEDANVLVVEVDVDVAVQLAVVAEQLRARLRMGLGERVEQLADVGAFDGDLALAADGRAQDRGNANRGHGKRWTLTNRRRRRTPRSPGRRPSRRRRSRPARASRSGIPGRGGPS